MADYPLAVVTGGAHRLGRAFSLQLARLGYAVLVHYHRSVDHARETLEELDNLGVPSYSHQSDLTKIDQIQLLFAEIDSLISAAREGISSLSVLVNSAAVMPREELKNLSAEDWDGVYALNVRAPFFCAQQAFLRMTRGGLIVNVTDVAAGKAWSGFPSYTVSKAALASLTKVMARSFAPTIRVNAIAPGLVIPSAETSREDWNRLVDRLPLKRSARPAEVAAALEVLIKNEYITGETITVDGGYSLL